jgi:succinate-acetate transporter protein
MKNFKILIFLLAILPILSLHHNTRTINKKLSLIGLFGGLASTIAGLKMCNKNSGISDDSEGEVCTYDSKTKTRTCVKRSASSSEKSSSKIGSSLFYGGILSVLISLISLRK